ncbi:Mitogen-activated protein kinase kinase kinase 1 [Cichlidogyrus casuarinus]|uniref:Mitogen-activated protein kinase kinase kinase 1 n=1 Tax=Cichlidogyrus casuarinus TaxID=1844966 RepID=A0ABD2Q824_9PLAT
MKKWLMPLAKRDERGSCKWHTRTDLQLQPLVQPFHSVLSSLRQSLCSLGAKLLSFMLVSESHLAASTCMAREDSVLLLKEAYNVAFVFFRSLVRLCATNSVFMHASADSTPSPLASHELCFFSPKELLEKEPYLAASKRIHRPVNLGISLIVAWARTILNWCPQGNGKVPRWALLELELNRLLPHLVGSKSPQHQALRQSPLKLRRKSHVLAQSRPGRVRHSSISSNSMSDIFLDLSLHSPSSTAGRETELEALQQLERRREERLRAAAMIGRVVPSSNVATPLVESGRFGEMSILRFPYQWMKGRCIGKGATGHVYEAYNQTTKEKIAVKFFELRQKAGCSTEQQLHVSQCINECTLLSGLSHSSLVRFLGAEESKDRRHFLIFMELCEAGTLTDWCKREALSEDRARHCAHDLVSAVAYLHDRHITHRDIKPDNLFLVHSDLANAPQSRSKVLVKLGDFGLAFKLPRREAAVKSMVGTQPYMAPETRALPNVDGYGCPCDIWSIGCVILQMLTGKKPWHNYPNHTSIYIALCQDSSPLDIYRNEQGQCLLQTSQEAAQILICCLNCDPNKRPSASQLTSFDFVRYSNKTLLQHHHH